MEHRKAALALLVLGLILLPGPAYAVVADDWTGGDDRHRSSQVVGATRLAPATDEGQRTLVRQYGTRVALPVQSLTASYARDDYEAPNRTAAALRAAIANGSAVATADPVRSDLDAVAREYAYLRIDRGADPADDPYYALAVDAGGDRTTVRATRANRSAVAATIRDRYVVAYDSLSPAERRTVDKVLNQSVGDGSGYRPYADEPLPDRPFVLEKSDAYYHVGTVAHVDDFSFPTGLLAGLVASGVGVLSVLAGLVVAAVGYVRGD